MALVSVSAQDGVAVLVDFGDLTQLKKLAEI